MRVTQYRIEGLGHLSTLVADERPASPRSSTRGVTSTSTSRPQGRRLRISHVVETHLHNDYVSGGRELAALTGATHVIGAGAARQRASSGRRRRGLRRRVAPVPALDTPGHTPEHVSYAVADTSAPTSRSCC